MKILLTKAKNGWVIRTKAFEEEQVLVCEVEESYFESDNHEAKEIMSLFHGLLQALEVSWGKRQKNNIRIISIPGYDYYGELGEEQAEAMVDMLTDILNRLYDNKDEAIQEVIKKSHYKKEVEAILKNWTTFMKTEEV